MILAVSSFVRGPMDSESNSVELGGWMFHGVVRCEVIDLDGGMVDRSFYMFIPFASDLQ